jgi:hypothetical protein
LNLYKGYDMASGFVFFNLIISYKQVNKKAF